MGKHLDKWLKSKKRGWGDLADFFDAVGKDFKATGVREATEYKANTKPKSKLAQTKKSPEHKVGR